MSSDPTLATTCGFYARAFNASRRDWDLAGIQSQLIARAATVGVLNAVAELIEIAKTPTATPGLLGATTGRLTTPAAAREPRTYDEKLAAYGVDCERHGTRSMRRPDSDLLACCWSEANERPTTEPVIQSRPISEARARALAYLDQPKVTTP